MTMPDLSRRAMFTLSAGAALAVARGASGAHAGLDLSTPAARLRAYMLMRAALDDRLVIGCLNARYYGVVETEVIPLFGVAAATFSRYRPVEGGGFIGASFEVPFYTDLDTGKVLDTWKNPYTGEQVSVPTMAFPPSKLIIGSDMTLTAPDRPPGGSFEHRVLTPPSIGDNICMVEETFTSTQIPGGSKVVRYTEIVTLHARASELAAPNAKRIRADTAYDSISSWRSWMKMSDHPGHLSGIGFGEYGVDVDQLPPNWLDFVRVRMPELLKDPGAALEPLLNSARDPK